MKRLLLAALGCLFSTSVFAQAVPAHLVWDEANPANVTSYTISDNGVVLGTSVVASFPVQVALNSLHEYTVTANGAGIMVTSAPTGYLAPAAGVGVGATVNKTISWTANPASDNVTSYTVTVGLVGQTGTALPPVLPPATSVGFAFTAGSTYTISVTATNAFGTGPATSINYNQPGVPPGPVSGLGVN